MEKKWSREKIIAQIEQDAGKLEIPDSLKPETILRKLQDDSSGIPGEGLQDSGFRAQDEDMQAHSRDTHSSVPGAQRKGLRVYAKAMAAAAAAVAVAIGGIGAMGIYHSQNSRNSYKEAEYQEGRMAVKQDSQAEEQVASAGKRKKVGNQYHLAADYDEIDSFYRKNLSGNDVEGSAVFNADSASGSVDMKLETAEQAEIAEDEAASASDMVDSGSSNYSKTNTMVEGVDEADIVKTDGNYIYICRDEEISIVDISGDNESDSSSGKMEAVSVITPDIGEAGSIHEIYIDKNQLMAIYSVIDTSIDNRDVQAAAGVEDAEVYDAVCDVAYEIGRNEKLTMATYDISDRKNPKLQGSVSLDGGYQTSRKVGSYIYLFSWKDYYSYAAAENSDIVPEINGEKAPADSIYLPNESGCSSLIAASVKITEPSKVADQMVIYNDYCQIYMSTDAIYLYNQYAVEEQGNGMATYATVGTNIAKFSYENGKMDAVDAVAVKGSVEDDFAIHGSDKGLQILTTDYGDYSGDGSSVNRLYLFDGQMNKTAMLDNIAAGEEVYAARYIGDIVYFITYHNTDPLFAVDISDNSNPKILGSLKINGFSDYLHPYGDNLLLGIGYETDPKTGEQLGVKLVMFDISDPADLKVLDTVIIEDMDDTSSTYDYKSVLADPDKNLIGVPLEKFINSKKDDKSGKYLEAGWKEVYRIYRWENGKFREAMSTDLGVGKSNLRGLYSGNIFYHICSKGAARYIESFDMDNGFRKLGKLTLD